MAREVSMKFAEQVKTAIDLLGWKQDDLAEAAGISQSMIGALLHGKRSPSLATAARVAAALKIRGKLLEYVPENNSENLSE